MAAQVHPHDPHQPPTDEAAAAATLFERMRRASTELTGVGDLGRGLLRLASNIVHNLDTPDEAAAEEEEAEATPKTRKEKMAHALKLVIDAVKGPVGRNTLRTPFKPKANSERRRGRASCTPCNRHGFCHGPGCILNESDPLVIHMRLR